MRIKALCSFSGVISMAAGEELEYENQEVIDDLLQAGYIRAAPAVTHKKEDGKPGRKKAVTKDADQ